MDFAVLLPDQSSCWCLVQGYEVLVHKVKHALVLGEAIFVEDEGQVVRVKLAQWGHPGTTSQSFFWMLLQNGFDLSPHICSSFFSSISGKWIGGQLYIM